MSAFKTQRSFEKAHQFLKISSLLVVVVQVLQLVGVDHDVKAAHLRKTELIVVDASEANFFPGSCAVDKNDA